MPLENDFGVGFPCLWVVVAFVYKWPSNNLNRAVEWTWLAVRFETGDHPNVLEEVGLPSAPFLGWYALSTRFWPFPRFPVPEAVGDTAGSIDSIIYLIAECK